MIEWLDAETVESDMILSWVKSKTIKIAFHCLTLSIKKDSVKSPPWVGSSLTRRPKSLFSVLLQLLACLSWS